MNETIMNNLTNTTGDVNNKTRKQLALPRFTEDGKEIVTIPKVKPRVISFDDAREALNKASGEERGLTPAQIRAFNNLNASAQLPPICNVMEFLAVDMEKPQAIIEGVLDKGSKMILSGNSKSHKTWSLAHLAVCVASGSPWWNFNTTRGRVLYINLEIDAPFFQDRIRSIKDHLVIDGQLLREGYLDVWNLRGYAADVEQMAPMIVERIGRNYDLVIIDPIYMVLGERDENSNGDITDLMNILDGIIKDTGAAIIFAHHFSKGNQAGKESIDRAAGAGAFSRHADTLLSLTKHQKENTFVCDVIVRNHKPVPSFCVELAFPIMQIVQDDVTALKVPGKVIKYTTAQLLEVLGNQILAPMEFFKSVSKKHSMSERTFFAKLKELEEFGEIEKVDGKWQRIK